MLKATNTLKVVAVLLISGLLLLTGACKTNAQATLIQPANSMSKTFQKVVPALPAAYYQCTSLSPMDLENAFYGECWNDPNANAMYDGQVFVFKDLTVDAWMIKDINSGWLWADLIKCPIVNIDDAEKLALGASVDIVGTCVGGAVSQDGTNYLIFDNCYILQPGSVQLPAPGAGIAFTSSYQ